MKQPSIAFVFLLAVMVRAVWWFVGLRQPSSDDLQYALMAEAIRHQQSFPLLAWGAGYAGTISTSWILAGLFTVFGSSLPVVLAYGAALSLLQVIVWMKIAKKLHPKSEGWVGLLLAVPAAHMGFIMQQISYADSLLVGAVAVWCVVSWASASVLSNKRSFLLGALIGYLFYAHPIPTVFAASLVAFWKKRVRINGRLAVAGLLVGASPLIAANILLRGVTLRRLGARILNMNAAQFSHEQSPLQLLPRLLHQVWAGLQAQPRLIAEAMSSDFGLTGIGIAVAFGLLVLLAWPRRPKALVRWVAWPVVISALVGNIFLGANGRARYLIPAYASSSLLAGSSVALAGAPAQTVVLAIALLNAAQTAQRVRQTPEGILYQPAIAYLRKQGLRYGYADYWQSMPLTFLSKGELQVASTATDAKGFWDRTVHITALADQASDVFYVFNSTNPMQKPFIQAFEALIASQKIACEKADIPPLRIYSHLSRPVRPAELDAAYRSLGFAAVGRQP